LIAVDSSAIIALISGEPIAKRLAECLQASPPGSRFISTASYVETGAVLAGRHKPPEGGPAVLDAFLSTTGIALAPFDERQARIALEARIRFGRGFGARAGLNLGDCYAYALAKSLDAPLLFTGDDFAATDITPALASLS
jgi:ribonuclease VapC